MLFVILNWINIAITAYGIGFFIRELLKRGTGYEIRSLSGIVMTGLVAITAYAMWVSCFARVNVEANLLLLTACLLIFVVFRKNVIKDLRSRLTSMEKRGWPVVVLVILVVAYFTSRGNYVPDTNLYHAQSIRWIEEYGIVPGLANLQSRAAYNSSIFCVSALYSMKYLFGQSMHAVQGFLALLCSLDALKLGRLPKHKKILLSDFARIGEIYYLTLLHLEIMSPSSDFAVMLVLFYLVITYVELVENGEQSVVPYSLLCVGGVFAVTLKMTAGLILIILAKPAYMLLRDRKWKSIAVYISMGILVIAPFLIRNVIVCGWLLYPLSAIDLFAVDWKVPKMVVDADSFQIRSWGKGIHDYELYHSGPAIWLPLWFRTVINGTERVLILADAAALAAVLLRCVSGMVSCLKRKCLQVSDITIVMLAVAASYLFWQFSAPLTRYGYAYILLLIMLAFGQLYIDISEKIGEHGQRVVLLVLLGCFFLWKGMVLVRGAAGEYLLPYYVRQCDYDTNEGEEYVLEHRIGDTLFYYGVSGYHKLPGGDLQFNMRGDTIREGFVFESKNERDVFGKYIRNPELNEQYE